MKSKKILSIIIAVVMAASVFAALPATASARQALEYKTGKKSYSENGVTYVKLTVKLPKLTAKTKAAKKINTYFTKLKNKYKKEAKRLVSSAKSDYKDNPEYFNSYSITLKAKLMYNKNGVYSFKIVNGTYTGGAHPNSFVKGVNFISKTGGKLSVSKLTKYSPSALKSKIIKATCKKIDKNPKLFYNDAKTTVRNTKLNSFNCILKGDYLYVVYQTYELAPYAAGPIKVKIKL